MSKLLSEADQCQSFRVGHKVHYKSIHNSLSLRWVPASIKWILGTNLLELSYLETTLVVQNHNPLEIAKTLALTSTENVSYAPAASLLRAQLGETSFKFFSLAFGDPGHCVDVFSTRHSGAGTYDSRGGDDDQKS